MFLAPAVLDVMTVGNQAVGELSVEALAKHTAESVHDTGSKVPTSTVSTNNKTSTMGAKGNDGSNPTALMVIPFKQLFRIHNTHNYINPH